MHGHVTLHDVHTATMIWIPIIGMADSENNKKKNRRSGDGKFPKSRPQKATDGQLQSIM